MLGKSGAEVEGLPAQLMTGSRAVNLRAPPPPSSASPRSSRCFSSVFFLWHFKLLGETAVQVGLGLALLIALLGFVVFQRLVGRISELVDTLRQPGAEAPVGQAAAAVPGLGEVTEIGEIARSFSRMLEDLRTSTERLEDLVSKLGPRPGAARGGSPAAPA